MEDKEDNYEGEEEEEEDGLKITDLPSEVLVTIFDFLQLYTLYFSVRPACSRFQDILSQKYFMRRFNKRYREVLAKNPLLEGYGLGGTEGVEEPVSWAEIAVKADLRERLCRREGDLGAVALGPPHITTVDAVSLFGGGKVMVSGGRDRMLCLWSMDDVMERCSTPRPLMTKGKAQGGWIWEISPHRDDNFFTCGFETTVRYWSLDRSLECVRTMDTERPALRISTKDDLLGVGLSTGDMCLYDPRAQDMITKYKAHRGIVTGVRLTDRFVVSIGEDRKICAYDLRGSGIIHKEFLTYQQGIYPRSLSFYRHLLYVGDTKGNIMVLDTSKNFSKIIFKKSEQERHFSINTIHSSLEGIVTGSSDGLLKFISVIEPMETQKEIKWSGEITSLDISGDFLVAGTTDYSSSIRAMRIKPPDTSKTPQEVD